MKVVLEIGEQMSEKMSQEEQLELLKQSLLETLSAKAKLTIGEVRISSIKRMKGSKDWVGEGTLEAQSEEYLPVGPVRIAKIQRAG